MGPNQTYKLLHNKGNHKENKKPTYRMGENIHKQCDCQKLLLILLLLSRFSRVRLCATP